MRGYRLAMHSPAATQHRWRSPGSNIGETNVLTLSVCALGETTDKRYMKRIFDGPHITQRSWSTHLRHDPTTYRMSDARGQGSKNKYATQRTLNGIHMLDQVSRLLRRHNMQPTGCWKQGSSNLYGLKYNNMLRPSRRTFRLRLHRTETYHLRKHQESAVDCCYTEAESKPKIRRTRAQQLQKVGG